MQFSPLIKEASVCNRHRPFQKDKTNQNAIHSPAPRKLGWGMLSLGLAWAIPSINKQNPHLKSSAYNGAFQNWVEKGGLGCVVHLLIYYLFVL